MPLPKRDKKGRFVKTPKKSRKRQNRRKQKPSRKRQVGAGKQFENSRFVISHGSTPTEPPPAFPSYQEKFKLPPGVRLVLFEIIGRIFRKYDAGFIYNWIVHTVLNDNKANIGNLDKAAIEIGLPNTKSYFCRVYQKAGETVPNILYTAIDPLTQLGVFRFTKGTRQQVPAYCTWIELRPGVWEPQWDVAANDADFNNALFGGSVQKRNRYNFAYNVFENPHQDLQRVATLAGQKARATGEGQTIYVISCRNYNSPSIDKVAQAFPLLKKNMADSQNLYNMLMGMVDQVFTNCNVNWNTPTGVKLDGKTLTVRELRQALENTLGKNNTASVDMMTSLKIGYDNLVNLTAKYLADDTLNDKTRTYNIRNKHPKNFWNVVLPEVTDSARKLRAKLEEVDL